MSVNILAWVSLAIVVSNLYMLSTSRLTGMIRGVATQGLLLSFLPSMCRCFPNTSACEPGRRRGS